MVVLHLLPGMTPEQGIAELRHSIGFGQPEVSLMYVLVEESDEQEP
jgi:hypothetical protein